MLENIVSEIICDEYTRCVRPSGEAMTVEFSLSSFWDEEDGYRHLTLMLYDFGQRYVGVFAKLSWSVWNEPHTMVRTESVTKGETPFVLQSYHDSCWRDAVQNVLRTYSDRIVVISSVFAGWNQSAVVTPDEAKDLRQIIEQTPGYGGEGTRTKLSDLEFRFNQQPV